jgi:deoxyribose-phosphate aldolase
MAGDLAGLIDHTLLRPDATAADIDRLCDEAVRNRFAAVCVHGTWVKRCAQALVGSEPIVCAVAGFPLGASVADVKAHEVRRALADGAREIDVVMNIGAMKSGDIELVDREIREILAVCRERGGRLKVILETALLTDLEKTTACRIAEAAGADFVKTSTGFAKGGATIADVVLMRRAVGPTMGIKAAGGIRDERTARQMIAAGATRIGSSVSIAIVGGAAG